MTNSLTAKRVPDHVFFVMDSHDKHSLDWNAKKVEMHVLVEEEILEPDPWQERQYPKGATRKYKLTDEGRRLASLSKDEVLAYFAKKNVHERKYPQMKWGL